VQPWLIGAAAAAAGGCGFAGELEVGESVLASLVSDYIATGCSTAPVVPLSIQIADEVACMAPDALDSFPEGGGVVFSGGAVIPYATPGAARDLEEAGATLGEIRINSAYRTVVQQYLLYQWYLQGRCGITAAAMPGGSNHESGRAIDVGNYDALRSALPDFGWVQTVPGDPVHFDHLASPDLRGTDVLGFQRLWNRNNPDFLIDEDGLYGPMTSMALRDSPAEGFPIAGCEASDLTGELLALDAPTRLTPGASRTVTVSVANTGEGRWPADAALETAMPSARDSALFDPESWNTPRQIATLGIEVEPGAEIDIIFALRAAPEAEPAAISESFQLVDGQGRAFGPLVAIDVEIGEAGDDLVGGCRVGAGGGSGALWLLLVVTVAAIRRRRLEPGDVDVYV
jgi:MYXO-CTERM domain-containing protein